MERILKILKGIRDDIDYDREKNLVDDGVLDSFDVVGIVSELCMEYDITITVDEITAENFNSAEAVYEMVNRILDEE